jgi:hypothetical protein
MSQLVEGSKLTFPQIARIIGSRPSTVREHYVAYTLLRQARDQMAIETSFADVGVLRRSQIFARLSALSWINQKRIWRSQCLESTRVA